MALNKSNNLINKKENQSTKKYNQETKNKSTSIRVSNEVKSRLENFKMDIMHEKRLNLSLSETLTIIFDEYENKDK